MVDAAKERFVFSENALNPFIGRGRFERKIIVQKKGLPGTYLVALLKKMAPGKDYGSKHPITTNM